MRRPPVRMADVMSYETPTTVTDTTRATLDADFQSQVEAAEAATVEVTVRESDERQLRDAGEVMEELNRIVTNVAADDDVATSTTDLIREVANQSLRRTNQRLAELPTTESSMTSRERLTLSIESITETLKKVWEAILAAAERVYEALLKAVMSFIGVLESALRLLQELEKDLPGLNWSDAAPVKSHYARDLSISNRLSPTWPQDVLRDLERCVDVDEEVYKLAQTVADEYVSDFDAAMRKNAIASNWDEQAARCQGLFKALKQKLAGVATTPSGKSEPGAKDTLVHRSGLLPGERRIQFSVPVDGLDAVPFMMAVGHCLSSPGTVIREPYPQNAAKPEISALPAVDKAVLKDAVTGGVKLLQLLLSRQEARKADTEQRKKKIGAMNVAAMKPMTDDGLDAQSKQLLMVLAKMSTIPMALDRPVDKYVRDVMPNFVRALQQVVKAYS